jgi:ferredoxin
VESLKRGEALAEMERGEQVAYDVARAALRMSGDKEVHVVCLESRKEMPADEIEVVEGGEEGIILHNSRGPRMVLGEDGKVVGLRTVNCTSVFDSDGRFNPKFDDDAVEDIPADSLIFAIGQTSDLSFLAPEDGVQTERGLIKVNPDTYQTSAPDVFACGDVAHGPRLFIDAIASAQIAARSMHDYLRRTRTDVVFRKHWKPASYVMADGWYDYQRTAPPSLEVEKRASSNEIVEETYPENTAKRQAARCLRCNVNTVFDTSLCIACNGCVDVCPESLIRLVGLSKLVTHEHWLKTAAMSLEVAPDLLRSLSAEELDSLGGVMMKDEATCIRCALCASRCPTHAITMKHFDFYRECVTVPAPNPNILYDRA